MNDNTNPSQYENFQLSYDEPDCMNDDDDENEEQSTSKENPESTENKEDKKEEEKPTEDSSSEQDGKYYVVQKGKACCDKGAKFPNFKVNSHQKHYWNDEKGDADYLSVTADDVSFNPAAMPFGTCRVNNGNPCAFSPAGKWTKTYDKVKIMGKKP